MIRVVAILAILALVGCAKGCSDERPATPAAPVTPGGLVPPPTGASPSEREGHYKAEVERLLMTLEVAKTGLKVARADAAAAEDKAWQTWTRWIGLAGFALAAAAAGILSWLVSPRIGLPVGGIVATVAAAVVAYGAAVRWLPLVLGWSAVLVGGIWLIYHLRHLRVAERASQAIDAVERKGTEAVRDAKLALGAAVDAGGLRRRLDRVRGKA